MENRMVLKLWSVKDHLEKLQLAKELDKYFRKDRHRPQAFLYLNSLILGLVGWCATSSVQVSVIALKLLAYMAMVMKMDYNAYVQATFDIALKKLGDKKKDVRDAAKILLVQLINNCTIMPQFYYDKVMNTCLKHWNWQMKEQGLIFITETPKNLTAEKININKHIGTICALLDDRSKIIQEKAMESLVNIQYSIDSKAFNANTVKHQISPAKLRKFKKMLQIVSFSRQHQHSEKKQARDSGIGDVSGNSSSAADQSVVHTPTLGLGHTENRGHHSSAHHEQRPRSLTGVCTSTKHRLVGGSGSDLSNRKDCCTSFKRVSLPLASRNSFFSFYSLSTSSTKHSSMASASPSMVTSERSAQTAPRREICGTIPCAAANIDGTRMKAKLPEKVSSDIQDQKIFNIKEIQRKIYDIATTLRNRRRSWFFRVKALKEFQEILYANHSMFTHESLGVILKDMEEAMIISLNDTRAQMIKETCYAITCVCKILQHQAVQFGAQTVPSLLDLIPNSSIIISKYAEGCIQSIIKWCSSPLILIQLYKHGFTSKSCLVRRSSAKFLKECIISTEASQLSDWILLTETLLALAIRDQDSVTRIFGRKAFWKYRSNFPSNAKKFLKTLSWDEQKYITAERMSPLLTKQIGGTRRYPMLSRPPHVDHLLLLEKMRRNMLSNSSTTQNTSPSEDSDLQQIEAIESDDSKAEILVRTSCVEMEKKNSTNCLGENVLKDQSMEVPSTAKNILEHNCRLSKKSISTTSLDENITEPDVNVIFNSGKSLYSKEKLPQHGKCHLLNQSNGKILNSKIHSMRACKQNCILTQTLSSQESIQVCDLDLKICVTEDRSIQVSGFNFKKLLDTKDISTQVFDLVVKKQFQDESTQVYIYDLKESSCENVIRACGFDFNQCAQNDCTQVDHLELKIFPRDDSIQLHGIDAQDECTQVDHLELKEFAQDDSQDDSTQFKQLIQDESIQVYDAIKQSFQDRSVQVSSDSKESSLQATPSCINMSTNTEIFNRSSASVAKVTSQPDIGQVEEIVMKTVQHVLNIKELDKVQTNTKEEKTELESIIETCVTKILVKDNQTCDTDLNLGLVREQNISTQLKPVSSTNTPSLSQPSFPLEVAMKLLSRKPNQQSPLKSQKVIRLSQFLSSSKPSFPMEVALRMMSCKHIDRNPSEDCHDTNTPQYLPSHQVVQGHFYSASSSSSIPSIGRSHQYIPPLVLPQNLSYSASAINLLGHHDMEIDPTDSMPDSALQAFPPSSPSVLNYQESSGGSKDVMLLPPICHTTFNELPLQSSDDNLYEFFLTGLLVQ